VITETTALGAAFLACLATGLWENAGSLMQQWKPGRIFVPGEDSGQTGYHFNRWQKAVERSRNWYPAKDIV
jgi:glycerol kinase